MHQDPTSWPALRDLWHTLLAALSGSGQRCVLFVPFEPDPTWGGDDVRWLVLDPGEQALTERLRGRGTVTEGEQADELAALDRMRASGHRVIDVSGLTPDQAAQRLVARIHPDH